MTVVCSGLATALPVSHLSIYNYYLAYGGYRKRHELAQ